MRGREMRLPYPAPLTSPRSCLDGAVAVYASSANKSSSILALLCGLVVSRTWLKQLLAKLGMFTAATVPHLE